MKLIYWNHRRIWDPDGSPHAPRVSFLVRRRLILRNTPTHTIPRSSILAKDQERTHEEGEPPRKQGSKGKREKSRFAGNKPLWYVTFQWTAVAVCWVRAPLKCKESALCFWGFRKRGTECWGTKTCDTMATFLNTLSSNNGRAIMGSKGGKGEWWRFLI